MTPIGCRHWRYVEYIENRSPVSNRPLIDPDQYQNLYMSPYDNVANLLQGLLDELKQLPEPQRFRFLKGEYSAGIEGALWTFEAIDHACCLPSEIPATLREVVVTVDPSGTTGDEDKRFDEVGIVGIGRRDDGGRTP
jgi:phage terminase large subunit-like protein